MTSRPPAKIEELAPVSERDAALAQHSAEAIARLMEGEDALKVTFTGKSGERLEAMLPAVAVRILARTLTEVARGNPVTLLPHRVELTTHEAAEALHVSRPFLIRLLDEGKIPHRKVGRHRRVRDEDIRAYIERENAARRETLRALAAYDQELGLYDPDDRDAA